MPTGAGLVMVTPSFTVRTLIWLFTADAEKYPKKAAQVEEARSALDQAIVQYTTFILDVPPSDGEEVPPELLAALQLKACMRRQTKTATFTIPARENAEMLWKDVLAVVDWLNTTIVGAHTGTVLFP